MKKQKAFTLIELLVVLAIIGLLSSIVLVATQNARDKANITKTLQFSASVHHALGAYALGVWDFNEGSGNTTNDISGNNNHGTISAGVAWECDVEDIPANEGCALDFSSGTGVNSGNSTSLQYDGDVTICFWAYAYNYASPERQNPINKAYGGEGTMAIETSGTISFYFGSCGGNCLPYTNMDSGAGFMENNKWIHVCAVRDVSARQVDWYKNSNHFSTRTWSDSSYDPAVSSNNFIIGDGYRDPFNGLLDDVRLYNEPLSLSQIKKLYAEGAKRKELVIE